MRLDRKPEVLAPAGTIETVAAVLDAGADAVYVGGKALNMRMHRSSYNLDDRQMAAAIKLVHERGRKLYITLNSLVFEEELPEMRAALAVIGQLRPDGIIVQDLAVAATAREVCVHVPLHASTMMNVHSIETAAALQLMGFVRIIVSRDIPLYEVRRIAEATGLEMEYFVHGDMCIAESSQCYGSGILFGESSNRGRCLKSCRWQWQLVPPEGADEIDPAACDGLLLARKDLNLIQHIPTLVQNKIVSLKIEGRMRTAEFLVPVVSAYREAVDAYFADPAGCATDTGSAVDLYERRVREYSTCMALYNPGASSVDPTGTREPRLFSRPKPEPVVSMPLPTQAPLPDGVAAPELVVRVGNPKAAEAAVEAGANAVYLGGEVFVNHSRPLDPAWVAQFAVRNADRGVRTVVLGTRIADERDLTEWQWLLGRLTGIRGLGVGASNLGALSIARQMRFREIVADFSLNLTNSQAADELSTQGATRVTASLELDLPELTALLGKSRLPVEVVVQGPLPAMVMSHCVVAATTGHTPHDVCPMDCRKGDWFLRDAAGQMHLVACDRRCRNHLLMARDVCALPNLARLMRLGPAALRIEAQLDSAEAVKVLTTAYRREIDAVSQQSPSTAARDAASLAAAVGRPMGDGAFTFPPERDVAASTNPPATSEAAVASEMRSP